MATDVPLRDPRARAPTLGRRWRATISRSRKRALHDVAHVSFLTLGLLSAWAAGLAHAFRGDDVWAAIGFGAIPCVVPCLAALVLGPGLSLALLVRWRDRLLMAAMGLFLAVCLLPFEVEDEFLWVPLAVYGAGATTLGLFWLLRARKRFA